MLRRAELKDRKTLGEVYCNSWKTAYKGIIPDGYLNSLTAEIWTPEKINPNNYILAEDGNGAVIGLVSFGCARDSGENGGELRAIYLLPEYWGRGYGRLLFSEAVRELRNMGYARFYLWVLKANTRARAFYEKMGMKRSEISAVINIGGKDIEEIMYEMCL